MKISVITPTFNNGHELLEALSSVANQPEIKSGQVKLELIVVDDGSDLIHQEKLDQLKFDFSGILRLIRLPKNLGPSAARNVGIKAASGDWVGFVDSDDIWPEFKIAAFWSYLQSGEFEILSGKIRYFSRNGSSLPDLAYEDEANRIHHVHLGALLAQRQVFEQGLYFNESLRFGEDTDWWIRVRESKKRIRLIEEETLCYHIHHESMTAKNQDNGREMLKLLHLSLKRRREKGATVEEIPSLKSFALPQIEVIIPVFNGEKFISQAIDSVLNQTFAIKKIWVVNDGSNDRTADILDQLKLSNPKLEVLHQPNKGVSAALNSVFPHLKEEWVAFLDADDIWMEDRIQVQVESLQLNPKLELIFGQIEEFEDFPEEYNGKFRAREGVMEGVSRLTLLCKRKLFEEFGGFDPSLKVGEFIAWFQRVREAGIPYQVIPKVLARRRIHGENMTAKVDRNEFLQLIRRQLAKKRNG